MFLAEHLDEEVRAAVDHLGVLEEVGHGVHHPEQLQDPPHPIEVAELVPDDRKQVQAGQAGVLRRLLGSDVRPDLARGAWPSGVAGTVPEMNTRFPVRTAFT